MVTNDKTSGNFKQALLAGTCKIVGNSILTVTGERRLSKNNHVLKVQDFRGATIYELKHRLVPLLKKKPKHVMLHI